VEYTIDAKSKKLGRLASEIAIILQGKKNANYEPRLVGDDGVTVENVKDLAFSANKLTNKIYYRHTGYIGHLKSKTLKEAFSKSPEKVLRHAVERMLPKNKLQKPRMKKLVIK